MNKQTIIIFSILWVSIAVMLMVIFIARPETQVVDEPVGAKPEATYFAELDENDVVIRVIVADQAFIDSGAVGDPANWEQTFIDNSQKARYAGKGYKYDRVNNKFKPKKPYDSWSYNETEDKWKAPINVPNKPLNEGEMWLWDEDNENWELLK